MEIAKGQTLRFIGYLVFFTRSKIQLSIHPPSYQGYRAFCKTRKGDEIRDPKDFIDRNQETDILVAFPNSEKETVRSGTWATVRYARKKKKTIYIFLSDGKIVQN
jgi:hypothetical protein